MPGDDTPRDPDFPKAPEPPGDDGPPRAPEAGYPPPPPTAPTYGEQSVDPNRPVLKEMGIGELIDTAIKVFRSNWKTILGIVAAVMIPFSFIQRFILDMIGPEQQNFFNPQPQPTPVDFDPLPIILTMVFFALQLFFVLPLITGAVTKSTADAYLNRPEPMGETFNFAVRKIPGILWAGFIYGLVVLIGFLLFIIPGIYLVIALTFTFSVVVLEGARGKDALERSRSLVKGHWWRVAGVLFLAGLMVGILGGIVTIPFVIGSMFLPSIDWVLLAIGDSISNVIFTPFQTMITVLLYFDLRIRKEAFDLALMAQEIAQPT